MRRSAYPKYKDSSIDWLGHLPTHWNTTRLKFIARRKDLKVDAVEENPLPYIGLEHVESWTGKLLTLDAELIPEGVSNRFASGDTLFGKLRPYLAKACSPDFDGLCSSELLVLKTGSQHRRYFLYQLLAEGFISLVDSSTYGVKMPRASWEFIGSSVLPSPPAAEQAAIANFLDRKTIEIEVLVAKKCTLIEKLKEKRSSLISRTVTRGLLPETARAAGFEPNPKMKPSEIEWLNDVPEHWGIKRIGYLSTVVRGASPRPAGDTRYFDGDFIPWITVGDVTKDNGIYLRETGSTLTRDGAELSRTMRTGTLVITNSGATLGVPKILAITGCANDGIVAFENMRRGASERFLFYFLSSITENLRDRIKQGSGQPNLNTEIIRAITCPYPPEAEQLAIADFLDRETGKIDLLVATVEQAIERLQEYRTALITAAVTGKIDVRQQQSGRNGQSGQGGPSGRGGQSGRGEQSGRGGRGEKAGRGPARMGVYA